MDRTVIDYFQLLDLSIDDGRQHNLNELRELEYKYNSAPSTADVLYMQGLIKKALEVFEDEDAYEDYVQKLNEEQQFIEEKDAEIEKLKQQLEDERKKKPAPSSENRSRADSGGTGWKSLLLELGKAAAKAYLEPKQDGGGYQNGSGTGASARWAPSLSGVWVSGDGLPTQFVQRGNRLQFRAVNAFGVPVVEGTGVLNGHQAQLAFRYFDGYIYDEAQATMEISANGWQMGGLVHYARSGPRYMQLVKQS
jgi:hypothetical protein